MPTSRATARSVTASSTARSISASAPVTMSSVSLAPWPRALRCRRRAERGLQTSWDGFSDDMFTVSTLQLLVHMSMLTSVSQQCRQRTNVSKQLSGEFRWPAQSGRLPHGRAPGGRCTGGRCTGGRFTGGALAAGHPEAAADPAGALPEPAGGRHRQHHPQHRPPHPGPGAARRDQLAAVDRGRLRACASRRCWCPPGRWVTAEAPVPGRRAGRVRPRQRGRGVRLQHGTLIAARVVMGLGAAFVMPATLSILNSVFPAPGTPAGHRGLVGRGRGGHHRRPPWAACSSRTSGGAACS